jgi:uncharacterized protein (TIGR02757 family)
VVSLSSLNNYLTLNVYFIRDLLEEALLRYNRPDFIEKDPLSIPYLFTLEQDQEIMGFWAAMLAWGQRKTILQKCRELIQRMDGAPYQFVLHHTDSDLKNLLGFKHRTFNAEDALYFVAFFKSHYQQYTSLEEAFTRFMQPSDPDVSKGLSGFHGYFFGLPYAPKRTQKHVPSPLKGAACKRINMFLRWMVRKDKGGVDLGLWKGIKSSQLVCPCDVHVERVARLLGLITRKPVDWKTALELTQSLRQLDPQDPVKYDLALFGLGLEGFTLPAASWPDFHLP